MDEKCEYCFFNFDNDCFYEYGNIHCCFEGFTLDEMRKLMEEIDNA